MVRLGTLVLFLTLGETESRFLIKGRTASGKRAYNNTQRIVMIERVVIMYNSVT